MKANRKTLAAAAIAAIVLSAGTAALANAALPDGAAANVEAKNGPGQNNSAPATPPASKTAYVSQNRVSAGASAAIASAALASCQAQKVPFVTVAVVDRFGTVQAIVRGDNAAQHTYQAAVEKAYTAAAFGAPTSELAKRVNGNGPSIADLPGTLFLAGGVPLKVEGVSVAGVGVGGAPDGAVDEKCAAAGAQVLATYAK